MEREILFRGKQIKSGEWIYGNLIINGQFECAIHDPNKHLNNYGVEVDPETVGQYTGLKDKNGNRIFEGDIIEFRPHRTGEIKWQQQNSCFYISYSVGEKGFYCEIISLAMYGDGTQTILTDAEVTGNIHEQPTTQNQGV